uniref:Uncharacterized protein n=1 Tax=Astyanax mexicanus TaxID=7994 RepID=A0A3B1IH12_ASTMX
MFSSTSLTHCFWITLCCFTPGAKTNQAVHLEGAELLFDGVKDHHVTLPGQSDPCEYSHNGHQHRPQISITINEAFYPDLEQFGLRVSTLPPDSAPFISFK